MCTVRLQPLRAMKPLGRMYFIHCRGTRKARRRLSGDCCTDASSAVVCTCPLTWCPPISSPTRADLRQRREREAFPERCHRERPACASHWRTLQAVSNPLILSADEYPHRNWMTQKLMNSCKRGPACTWCRQAYLSKLMLLFAARVPRLVALSVSAMTSKLSMLPLWMSVTCMCRAVGCDVPPQRPQRWRPLKRVLGGHSRSGSYLELSCCISECPRASQMLE